MTSAFNIDPRPLGLHLRPVKHWREPSSSKALGIALSVQSVLAAERRADERDAFISLALTQRRLSWVYRKWALESEAEGNLDAYRRYAREARRLWRDAREHLAIARRRNPK